MPNRKFWVVLWFKQGPFRLARAIDEAPARVQKSLQEILEICSQF